jgi:ATPase family associated with various cellular activities (AAA)
MEPYHDSLEHITDELRRIDLLLRREVLISRQPNATAVPEAFRGLVISESEINNLLSATEFVTHRWRNAETVQEKLAPIDQKLAELRASIDERRKATQQAGRSLSLPYLAEKFILSPAEVDILLICIAPELEPRYETFYAYLQDDVTRKRASVDLCLNLTCRSHEKKVAGRRMFVPGAQLVHWRLIELSDEPHDRQPTLLRKFAKVDPFVLNFLLEHPPSALSAGTLVSPHLQVEDLDTTPESCERLKNLATALARNNASNSIIRLTGPSGALLDQAAEALSHTLDFKLILADILQLDGDTAKLAALARDLVLFRAALAVNVPERAEPGADAAKAKQAETAFWKMFQNHPYPVILMGTSSATVEVPIQTRVWDIEVDPPAFDSRKQIWQQAVSGIAGSDAGQLAESFHFSGAHIRKTGQLAWSRAALRNPSDPAPSNDDVLKAARSLTAPNLGRLAIRVDPQYDWDDLVLPDRQKRQLSDILTRAKFRSVVHRDWGFGEKLSRGKGLNVLFTGESGTGKSMAAEVLARALALEMFQIDLSTVVSKYIGETEKNLGSIFREAENGASLLFFDEADALFGKRTEVKDAHDRYANIEVNYLLQRVEQYEGVVVLATNLQRNLDDAFLRRMQEVVEFPFPDQTMREEIWRKHFPKDAPLDKDINLPFLAKQFKLTGADIKSVTLHAAFQAAQAKEKIGMHRLVDAVKSEFLKKGKLVTKSDFGEWFDPEAAKVKA